MAARSTRDVFEDHLRLRKKGDLEEDLRNYAPDVAILNGPYVFHGHGGVRESARLLHEQVPDGTYHYDITRVIDDFAYLEWSADAQGVRVQDGVDSFLIRDGVIQVQTIHYSIVPEE